jgi:signal transduction histidine kinase
MSPLDGMRGDTDLTVGAELTLPDLLSGAEAAAVLDTLFSAGFLFVRLSDRAGKVIIYSRGQESPEMRRHTLDFEGEPFAFLDTVAAPESDPGTINSILAIACAALHGAIQGAARRTLTVRLHTSVVRLSYEELLEANKQLRESETRYRELAESLERQVHDRTAELKEAGMRMLKQKQQAAIGNLAAGIAHEINTPLGFMLSNLRSLSRYMGPILALLKKYALPRFRDEDMERLQFMIDDIPPLLEESVSGGERIRAIVTALTEFSHLKDAEVEKINLRDEFETLVTILGHEIASREAVVDLDGVAPVIVSGNCSHIAQALLAVMMNALQSRAGGVKVKATARMDGPFAEITISDNGEGMSPETLSRIFDPFFTTKEVGAGSGLGLTMAYDIISSHGGSIEVTSSQGTTVRILLPAAGVDHG